MIEQLAPAYETFKDYIEVVFVPFGHSRVSVFATHPNSISYFVQFLSKIHQNAMHLKKYL